MINLTFITGNQHKVEYLQKWLGMPVEHQKVDLDEIQSLDPREVVEDKARRAFEIVGKPVLVEDVALTCEAFGRLPGTLIKWFLEEVGTEGICKMMQPFDDKRAKASIMYGLFDGTELHTFSAEVAGMIPPEPRSLEGNDWKSSKSWNSIFVPKGAGKTYAEMTDEELEPYSHRAKATAKLREFLTNQ